MAQWNKTYQASTHTQDWQGVVGLDLFMGFVDNKKNITRPDLGRVTLILSI